jgi:hypothetical protein
MRLKLERRIEQPRWLSISTAPILIVAALLVGALLLRLAGANPWAVYRSNGADCLWRCLWLVGHNDQGDAINSGCVGRFAGISHEDVEYRR